MAFLLVLGIGAALGALARLVLGARDLTWSATVVAGTLGAGVGSAVVNVALGDSPLEGVTVLWRLVGPVLGAGLAVWIAALLKRRYGRSQDDETLADTTRRVERLIGEGESDRVEFKASARYNLRTGEKDPRLEAVVSRSVAGFLNGGGGALLIGVDDTGEPVGLANDYALCRRPDADRFLLWLHDHLGQTLGKPALRDVRARVVSLDGKDVCAVDVTPAPSPVFVNPSKGERTSEFWLRVGNSTRKLLTDEVLDYQARRWPN